MRKDAREDSGHARLCGRFHVGEFAPLDPFEELRAADANLPGDFEGGKVFDDLAECPPRRVDAKKAGDVVESHDLGSSRSAKLRREDAADIEECRDGGFGVRELPERRINLGKHFEAAAAGFAFGHVPVDDAGPPRRVNVAGNKSSKLFVGYVAAHGPSPMANHPKCGQGTPARDE